MIVTDAGWDAAASGASRRGIAKLHLNVIAREAKQSILSSCREMDCFASLAMTFQTESSRAL